MDNKSTTVTTIPDEPASGNVPPASNNKRKWLMGGFSVLFILCGAAYGTYWASIGRFAENTNDAYVAGNVVELMPRVNGTVIAIRADNTQLVKQGDAVVRLDSTDARIALKRAEAKLAQAVRQVQGLYQTEAQQHAKVSLQRAKLTQSKSDYRRTINLATQNVVSVENYQHSGTHVDIDQASLDLAEHELAATRAAVANTGLDDHPQVILAEATLRDAYVALQRTTISAPVTGYVDKRSVQVGERVSPGKPLMAIIPLDQVWVDANFKESQLRNVRIGQPVSLTADLYSSDVEFQGRVLGLGAGTGSAFAVLPPQNATGNWIKVVQRVPVRIRLDPAQIARYPLLIGLSMVATIDTHSRSGAELRDNQEPQDVYVTSIFHDEDKGAEALIARIIRDNTVTILPTQATETPAAESTPTQLPVRTKHNDIPAATAEIPAARPLRNSPIH